MSVHKSTNSTRELHVLFLTGLMIWTVVLANLYYSTQESNQVYRFRTSRSLDYAPDSIPQHKNLLPIDNTDIIGSLLVAFGLMMSAAGGIGGGGILVPLLIIVFNFEPKFAIPLSNITILGSSITNVIMNLPKRHPDADRPLIDWDLILLMEPLTMAGAVRIMQSWSLITIILQSTHFILIKF